jgi:site-specific recombinase XerD
VATPLQEIFVDAFESFHPVPAAWLRDSDLAPFVPAYVRHLVDRHYAVNTVRMYVYGVAHFAHWTRRHRVDLRHLAGEVVQRFVDEHLPRCTCPPPVQRCRHQVRAALRQLLVTLVDAGVLISSRQPDAIEDQLERFDGHMVHARGLAETTRIRRRSVVRSLLQFCAAGESDAMAAPSTDQLRRFITRELSRISPASASSLAGALRGYLRFLALSGARVDHLLPVIASPAHWRLAPLPQTLSPSEVARLLDAFPPELPSHLRGYAMVRCLVDLGLREREVVSLELDDIDWEAGTLRIRKGKSRRVDVLPLPQTTGRAIAAYLRSERPTTVNRRVFVRHVAPLDEPIRPDVVRNTVRLAYRRCGLPYTRVHILRHTLASRLLETGGTLKEVADMLRHRDLDTSMIYAKVDIGRLAAVAMPWPGSVA